MAQAEDVRATYDAVADEYATRIAGELAYKPFDREWLDAFAARMAGGGRVVDLGCGPGHVTGHLAGRGVDVVGLDLSPRMIAQARRRHPGLRFETGDLTALARPATPWAGAVAYYSLIHFTPDQLTTVLTGISAALAPGAPLLVAFHVGDEVRHLDEWWGIPVSIDVHFHPVGVMTAALQAGGFEVGRVDEREAYPDVEVQTRRAYMQAQRSRASGDNGGVK